MICDASSESGALGTSLGNMIQEDIIVHLSPSLWEVPSPYPASINHIAQGGGTRSSHSAFDQNPQSSFTCTGVAIPRLIYVQ